MSNAKALEYLELARLELQGDPAVAPPYSAPSDRIARVKPPLLPLGPAGFTFADPTFGSRILRVTDEKTAAGASWRVPSNAHLAAWSAGGKFLTVVGNAGKRVYAFDPVAMSCTFLTTVSSQTEPQWSRVDPATMFTVGGPITRTLRKSSWRGSAWVHEDLLDLDTLGLPLVNPRTYVGGICSSAAPEVLVAMFGGYEADQHRYVLWMPLDGRPRKLIDIKALHNCFIHTVSVDHSGRYVVIDPPNTFDKTIAKKIVWDTTADTFTFLPEGSARAGGHHALGYGVMVNMEGTSDGQPWDAAQWPLRSLATPLVMTDLITPVLLPKEVYLDDHTSWNHVTPGNHEPFVSSTFRTVASTDGWRAWDDEIIGVTPTPGGPVYRFAHHRSKLGRFEDQAIVNSSPDGNWALVHTNWEKSLGTDPDGNPRQDVFVVALR